MGLTSDIQTSDFRHALRLPSRTLVAMPTVMAQMTALSEQRRVVCVGRSTRRPKRRLGREGAPLGQRGGAPLFVNLAGDEMALLIEMVVTWA